MYQFFSDGDMPNSSTSSRMNAYLNGFTKLSNMQRGWSCTESGRILAAIACVILLRSCFEPFVPVRAREQPKEKVLAESSLLETYVL